MLTWTCWRVGPACKWVRSLFSPLSPMTAWSVTCAKLSHIPAPVKRQWRRRSCPARGDVGCRRTMIGRRQHRRWWCGRECRGEVAGGVGWRRPTRVEAVRWGWWWRGKTLGGRGRGYRRRNSAATVLSAQHKKKRRRCQDLVVCIGPSSEAHGADVSYTSDSLKPSRRPMAGPRRLFPGDRPGGHGRKGDEERPYPLTSRTHLSACPCQHFSPSHHANVAKPHHKTTTRGPLNGFA